MFCRLKKSATCNPFNRREYFELMRSAVDAGIIIANVSMIKILFAQLHLAPLTETILFSLNYGFVDSHFYTSLWPSNSLPSLF
jgi:site-specific recombinase